MIDPQEILDSSDGLSLTPEIKAFLNETRSKLKGSERRKFMAQVVRLMGKGGQLRAEQELGWDDTEGLSRCKKTCMGSAKNFFDRRNTPKLRVFDQASLMINRECKMNQKIYLTQLSDDNIFFEGDSILDRRFYYDRSKVSNNVGARRLPDVENVIHRTRRIC